LLVFPAHAFFLPTVTWSISGAQDRPVRVAGSVEYRS
jgi:hypothetical protein